MSAERQCTAPAGTPLRLPCNRPPGAPIAGAGRQEALSARLCLHGAPHQHSGSAGRGPPAGGFHLGAPPHWEAQCRVAAIAGPGAQPGTACLARAAYHRGFASLPPPPPVQRLLGIVLVRCLQSLNKNASGQALLPGNSGWGRFIAPLGQPNPCHMQGADCVPKGGQRTKYVVQSAALEVPIARPPSAFPLLQDQ